MNKSRNISFSIGDARQYQEPEPFNPKDYAMPGASERDILVFKEIFDILDIDNNNLLTPMEIRNAMIQVGYNVKKQTIYQLLSDLDVDESGYIDFYEFVKLMTMKPGENDTVEDITKVFYEYDIDKKGYITIQDLRRVVADMRENISEEDLQEMIVSVDPNGDGKISLQAWIDFMRKPQS
jgi:Ca2+-binding protein (EF-Hand superfamily)